jgi:hypothetical protein
MRKQFISMLVLAGLVMFGAGAAKAQLGPGLGAVTATVPFEFHAGDARFPAGKYTIKRLNEIDPSVLEIAAADGKMSALVSVHAGSGPKDSKTTELVFNKYGSRFFLAAISVEGTNLSSELERSRFEKLVGTGETPGGGQRVPAAHKAPVKK